MDKTQRNESERLSTLERSQNESIPLLFQYFSRNKNSFERIVKHIKLTNDFMVDTKHELAELHKENQQLRDKIDKLENDKQRGSLKRDREFIVLGLDDTEEQCAQSNNDPLWFDINYDTAVNSFDAFNEQEFGGIEPKRRKT